MWWRSRRAAKDQEIEEEIRVHFEIEVQRRLEAGEPREHAEQAARRLFGNVGLVTEATRQVWRLAWLDELAQDLKYAARVMAKTPGFAAITILTVALGVGATTAVFSVTEGVLLKPLPFPQANRIFALWRVAPLASVFGQADFPWGKADFNLFKGQAKVFETLAAFEPDTFNLTRSGQPVFLEGTRVTADFFPTLGINPEVGRFFNPQEDTKGHEHVVMLGDALWRERFAADRHIVGRSIELNGVNYTVVGVMPPGFSFPHAAEMPIVLEFPAEAQLWVPLAIGAGERGPSELAVIGRVRPQITPSQLQAELDVFARTLARAFPAAKDWSRSRPVRLQNQITGDTRQPLLLLLGAVALVLMVACSNVAGLLLTRSLERRHELQLRAALGAGYGRLIRQLMTESLLLATIGGVLGLALAEVGILFVKNFGPSRLPRLQEVTIDPAIFGFCIGLTLLTGLLFGLAPSFQAARDNAISSLRAGARVIGSNFARRLRQGLLVGQIALAFVLVVAAGLLARSFYNLLRTDGGFKVEHVLTFEISLPHAKYPDPDHMAQLYTRALHTLQALPGVQSAGMVHAVPMGGTPDSTVIRVPGRTPRPHEQEYANYMFTSPGYFSAVRTPLLRGRDFEDSDTLNSAPVTIVNRTMAHALWPGKEALGKQVGVASLKYPVRTVIGVVADVKQSSLREETPPEMYVPFTQSEIKVWPPMQTMQVALRTAADPTTMISGVRQAMNSVDPELPLAKLATLSTLVDHSLTQPRFSMMLLTGFALLALALASVGMYGVISYSVTQRNKEIGIRMALGAERASVFGMVLKQGFGMAGIGIVIGLLAAFVATRTLSAYIYGVRPFDPLTFGSVCALLAALVALASWVPARRATRVDPVVVLRD